VTLHAVRRRALFAFALVAAVLSCNVVSHAAVDVGTGIRYVVSTGTLADCSTKAQTALNTYLQTSSETETGSGEWVAYGPNGSRGPSTTVAATVHCYPLTSGYVVTFDCIVELPNNPYNASDLCLDIAHTFSGKPVTPLASPTPPPSGCSTSNLVGTWTSDDRGGPTLTITPDGNLTDGDGVSGNWVLFNSNVTLTYYGNHSLTLAPDGKHMSGGGYHFTRKC
jgi:hypothetical protein